LGYGEELELELELQAGVPHIHGSSEQKGTSDVKTNMPILLSYK
jgi:hypothetical protein